MLDFIMRSRVAIIVLAMLVLGVVIGAGYVGLKADQQDQNRNLTNSDSVIEFPKLTICRQTGGNWTKVLISEYNDSREDTYKISTSDEAFRCVCPVGTRWTINSHNETEGCV
jgi:hypothetical protein